MPATKDRDTIKGLMPGEKPSRRPPSFWDGNFKINPLSTFIICFPPLVTLFGLATGVEVQLKTVLTAIAFLWFNGLGITVGYHRLFSHCSYVAHWTVQAFWIFAGAGALQGSAKWWARNHRIHHRYVDTDLDPYNALRGFGFSHLGWMIMKQDYENLGHADMTDLNLNKIVQWQHKYYFPLSMLSSIILPTLICGLGWGDWAGGYCYAAMAKAMCLHHFTFFINSLAHSNFFWATQSVTDEHTAHDSPVCALMTFGEGYHNFHHEFAQDYRNGLKWYQYDPSKWIIRSLEVVGLAWNLHRTPNSVVERSKSNLKHKQLSAEIKHHEKKIDAHERSVAAPTMWTKKDVAEKVAAGRKLIILGDYVLDLEKTVPTGAGYTHQNKDVNWYNVHPGGRKVLDSYVGKDATEAMTGGVYKHRAGAFTLIAHLRVASLKK